MPLGHKSSQNTHLVQPRPSLRSHWKMVSRPRQSQGTEGPVLSLLPNQLKGRGHLPESPMTSYRSGTPQISACACLSHPLYSRFLFLTENNQRLGQISVLVFQIQLPEDGEAFQGADSRSPGADSASPCSLPAAAPSIDRPPPQINGLHFHPSP